ncbi:bacterial conjugation TrbI-like family protein, partial [Orientia chuto str. Dubai]
ELVQSLEKRESREEISGVEQAVNPRAKWTDEVEVKTLRTELEKAIENKHLETKAEINDLHQKMSGNLEKQTHQQIDSDLLSKNDYQETTDTKVIEKSMSLQRFVEIKKDVENYVTSGSSAKAILLTGVVVGTGTNSSSSLDPIVLQLLNQAILYDEYKTDQIKKAILIGSCNGDVASERAKCRLETLSVINNTGDIIEKKVEGWLIGEDGLPGIKGMVVDKSSDAVRMAALNFVFSGIAKSLQVQAINQDMQTVQSLNSVTASQQEFGEAVKSGSDSGGSNTFDKLADFAIKIADAMSPVIVVDSGRVVDVVFKKGFDLLEHNKKNSNFTYISNVDLNVNQSENI